jgi:hypothetical protein
MRTQRLAAYFAMTAGMSILAWWLAELAIGAAASFTTEDWVHVAAEVITALVLLSAAYRMLLKHPGGRRTYLLGSGMLIYATVNAAGGFAVGGNVPMVLVLLATAGVAAYLGVSVGRGIQREP